jgi:hypothetical protein
MALAWWLVSCLPFPGLPHIYFMFTVRLTNEWVGVFLPRRSHISNIKSFLPVEAEISVTKVWTDGRTNGRTDGQGDCKTWISYTTLFKFRRYPRLLLTCDLSDYILLWMCLRYYKWLRFYLKSPRIMLNLVIFLIKIFEERISVLWFVFHK